MADFAGDTDADLVAAALAGNRDAFEALLRRHYDRIHGLAWQLTGSRADAEDITQDVCCALVEKIGSFRGEAKFSTWLTGVTFNACRDFRRRRRTFAGLTEQLAVLAGLTVGCSNSSGTGQPMFDGSVSSDGGNGESGVEGPSGDSGLVQGGDGGNGAAGRIRETIDARAWSESSPSRPTS